MSFGWSAGDIIAALQVLNKVRIALKDSGGSKTDYQDATAFIDTLSTTLRTLDSIRTTSPYPELLQDVSQHVQRLRQEIDLVMETIQSDYGESLGPFPTSSKTKIFQRKVQYAMSTSNKVQDLRKKLSPELSTLLIKLTNHMLFVCAKLPFDIQRQMEHTTKATLEIYRHNPEIDNIVQNFESQGVKLDSCYEQNSKILSILEVVNTEVQVQSLQRRQRRIPSRQPESRSSALPLTQDPTAETAEKRFEMDFSSSILQGSQQVAVGLIGIFRAVVCLLSLAMVTSYQKTIQPVFQQLTLISVQPSARGIKLIDALGRSSIIPYDCGRSWEIFQQTIKLWFHGCPGEDLVRHGMYHVANAKLPSRFFTEESWSGDIKDGTTIRMSIITKMCTDCGGRMASDQLDDEHTFCSSCNKPYLTAIHDDFICAKIDEYLSDHIEIRNLLKQTSAKDMIDESAVPRNHSENAPSLPGRRQPFRHAVYYRKSLPVAAWKHSNTMTSRRIQERNNKSLPSLNPENYDAPIERSLEGMQVEHFMRAYFMQKEIPGYEYTRF